MRNEAREENGRGIPDSGESTAPPAFQGEIGYARMLIARLERLSVDSFWAHRSSGLRGSLLRALENLEAPEDPERTADDLQRLQALIEQGAAVLEKAAREIHGDEPMPS